MFQISGRFHTDSFLPSSFFPFPFLCTQSLLVLCQPPFFASICRIHNWAEYSYIFSDWIVVLTFWLNKKANTLSELQEWTEAITKSFDHCVLTIFQIHCLCSYQNCTKIFLSNWCWHTHISKLLNKFSVKLMEANEYWSRVTIF